MFMNIADSSDRKRVELIEIERLKYRASGRAGTTSANFRPPEHLRTDIVAQDIQRFFCFSLYCMIDKKANITEYFSEQLRTSLSKSIYSEKREYTRIRASFYFPTVANASAEYYHIEWFLSTLNERFKRMILSPCHFWAMDESLAQYKGRHGRLVCIKYKPNPYGFRVFVLNHRLGFAAHLILDFGLNQVGQQTQSEVLQTD